jgi:hypothetical protein
VGGPGRGALTSTSAPADLFAARERVRRCTVQLIEQQLAGIGHGPMVLTEWDTSCLETCEGPEAPECKCARLPKGRQSAWLP